MFFYADVSCYIATEYTDNVRCLLRGMFAQTIISSSAYLTPRHSPFLGTTRKKNGPHTTDWWVLMTANAATNTGLTCLPKYERALDNILLVNHLMTDLYVL
jgi:hypothetical protein